MSLSTILWLHRHLLVQARWVRVGAGEGELWSGTGLGGRCRCGEAMGFGGVSCVLGVKGTNDFAEDDVVE